MAVRSRWVEWADGAVAVRRAMRNDLPAVEAIERASFGDPWPTRAFSDALRDEGLLFLVAAEADRVLGYVVAWFVMDEGEVANLAVDPAMRGRGVGKTLLDAALDVARGRRVTSMYLEVRESNVVARALYGSRQFTEIGRRRGYYRSPVEDAIVMRRLEADCGIRAAD